MNRRNMRIPLRLLALLTVCLAGSPLFPVASARGVVSHRISGCDYFVVETRTGYDLLEWYGDHDPDKGDILIGNYESYGFHDVLDETADETVHLYTEDYQLSKSEALERMMDHCE